MPEPELDDELELVEDDAEDAPSEPKPPKGRETVAERIARVKRRTREIIDEEYAAKLKSLGITDWAELQEIQRQREEAAAAQLSEKERLEKELGKKDKTLADTQSAYEKLLATVRQDKRKSAILTAASGCKYPETVWLWVQANKAPELDQAQDADGTMKPEVVTALVGECAKAMPDLFRVSDVPTPSLPARATNAPNPHEMTPTEYRRQARKAGY